MKQRGKRIRPSGKDLVFHFTIASLLPVFLLVVGLFHVKTIQQINWQDFNLSQADKIDIPYLIISFSVAILICLLVAFVFKRVRYDTVKQLYHRQKLAKMILENKWYESEQVKTALWIFEVCHCLCTATKADLCRKKSNAWQKPATRSHYSS